MAYGSPWGPAASYLGQPGGREPQYREQLDYEDKCVWPRCYLRRYGSLPLCTEHAWATARVMEEFYPAPRSPWPREIEPDEPVEPPKRYVYYLMLSPTTIKIGTTKCLTRRIRELRTELQYVVAIERGGIELEHQRHREFADERRHKLREDFYLSDRLKAHIDTLAVHRDELMAAAA